MTDRETFYNERDRRTLAYGVTDVFDQPVGIVVGRDAAETLAGQVAALALVNMVSRIHRTIKLVVPSGVPLIARSIVPAHELSDACVSTALAIDPYIQLDLGTGSMDIPVIGLGTEVTATAFVYGDGFLGGIGLAPRPFGTSANSIMGAALAACFGAGELLRLSAGVRARERIGSLWNFDDPGGEAGVVEGIEPIDVGSVAVVGAGAVASGLAYWLQDTGVKGDWVFIDGDQAALHNTNRTIGLVAADAGWLDGRPGGPVSSKAQATAKLIGARYFDGWYDEWLRAEPTAHPDLVLPLANEFDVRHSVGARGETILLHATTSPAWTAEFHRHIAGRDGCIDCRFPPGKQPVFRCSEGPLPEGATDGHPGDAALPFLSAAAGLMLLTALVQLQAGTLERRVPNHEVLFFGNGLRTWSHSTWPCFANCPGILPDMVREQINVGKRWSGIR